MKRKLLLFVILLMTTLLAVGCGKKETTLNEVNVNENENEKKEIINLTVWAEEANFDLLNVMIDEFKKQNNDVTLNIELVHQNDADLRDVLLEDVTAGADVFHFPDDQLNSLIAGGILSRVPNETEIKTANTEGSVDAASLNGSVYAYPITADNGYFLYYNKEYLSEEDVKSLDRILEVAESSGKKFEMELNSGWYLYSFFSGAGLDVGINEDGVTNHCNWNTTEGTYTGVDVTNSIKNVVYNPAFLMSEGNVVENAKNDTIIACVNGVWNAIGIKEAWGEDYGACKMPTFTCKGDQVQMGSFTGFKMVGVNRYSENIEWAHKFANFISNEENQKLRFEMKNQGPSNINAAKSDEILKVPAIQAVIAQSEFGTLQRIGNNYWSSCTDFINAIANKTAEAENVQKLLDETTKKITASVAE